MPYQKICKTPLTSSERQPAVARVRRALATLLDRHGELGSFGSALVACSGGADSSTLLDALVYLSRSRHLHVEIAHVDHGLRSGSDLESGLVRLLAQTRGVPFHELKVEVDTGKGVSVQDSARAARMEALEQLAGERGCEVVAFGHTADDQAETVLMRVLDGAAPAALAGILPRSGMRIHPLLGVWRGETEAYCRAIGIEYLEDPSNWNLRYRRVRIRQEVMPVLETISPGVRRRLVVLGARLSQLNGGAGSSFVPRDRSR